MSDGRGVLREIAWRELLPWLVLFKTFRLSIHPAILGVSLLAAILTPVGWALFGRMLISSNTDQPVTARRMSPAEAERYYRLPGANRELAGNIHARILNPDNAFTRESPIVYVFDQITSPVRAMYRYETSLRDFVFYLLGTLWTLAVWAFAGGMITRIAAMEIGREEQAGIRRTARLTLRRWVDYFTAPLYPVLGTFLIALLSAIVGLLIRPDVGTVVGGLLWIFVLLGGAVSALLLLWLFIGWPLMWPAISSEETGDAFEAMSRSFAYAFQRPLHYLFYAFVATVFGYICWSVVDFVCQLTLDATHWGVSWGSGGERLSDVLTAVDRPASDVPGSLRAGSWMIRGVESILRALSESFAYAFFWVSATAIYLLLRQDVDRAEFDEVWADDDTPRQPLPTLSADSADSTTVPMTSPAAQPPDPPAAAGAIDNHNQAE